MMIRFFAFILCWCFMLCSGNAQNFGGEPPQTQWKKMESGDKRIIFPKGYDHLAQQYMETLEAHSEPDEPTKPMLNIVLRKNGMTANGFVSSLPFKSEFYLHGAVDPFVLSSSDWENTLGVHEYQHVKQYRKSLTGITKLAHSLLGDMAWTGIRNLALPNWYLEGEAVLEETMHTSGGRGRLPSWNSPTLGNLAKSKPWSYYQVRQPSYNRFQPNHYQFGYLLLKYGVDKYGENFWEDVAKDAARYKGIFWPFARSVKKRTGMSLSKLYQEAVLASREKWQQEALDEGLEQGKLLVEKQGNSFYSEHWAYENDEGIFVVKSSPSSLLSLYKYDQDKLRKIKTIGQVLSSDFSGRDEYILWSNVYNHERWTNKEYADIVLYNTKSTTTKVLTHKGRYQEPDLNPSKDRVLATYRDSSLHNAIHVLDLSGQLLKKYRFAQGFVSDPTWISDESFVILKKDEGQMSIVKLSVNNNDEDVLFGPVEYALGHLYAQEDVLYFAANFESRRQVYSIPLSGSGALQQVSAVPTRGDKPSRAGDGKLFLRTYTEKGSRIAIQPLDKSKDVSIKTLEDSFGTDKPTANRSSTEEYHVSDFPGHQGLFNVHSWSFLWNNGLSFELWSDNIRNDFKNVLGLTYDTAAKGFRSYLRSTYGRTYVHLETEIGRYWQKEFKVSAENPQNVLWPETYVRVGGVLPLQVAKNQWFTSFRASLHWNSSYLEKKNVDSEASLWRHFIDSRIIYKYRQLRARKDIFPRWGAEVDLRYRQALASSDSYLGQASAKLYAPGLWKDHGINLTLVHNVQQRNESFYFTENPGMVGQILFLEDSNDQVSAAKFSYALPLVYPDFGLPNWLWIKRIRTQPFVQRSWVNKNKSDFAGNDLWFDVHLFNLFPVSTGYRYFAKREKGMISHQHEFLFSISLF